MMDSEIHTIHPPKLTWYYFKGEQWWYLPHVKHITSCNNKAVWNAALNDSKTVEINLKKSASILFYGLEPDFQLPITFLDDCNKNNISITLHRTHQSEPLIFYKAPLNDRNDTLTCQMAHRADKKQSAYIARTLVSRQWYGRNWLTPSIIPDSDLAACRNVESIINIEALASKDYWLVYYSKLGLKITRRDNHAINEALDAGANFLSGIILRWILANHLSPAHAFLHKQTSYPALVHDLIEPLRWIVEKAAFDAWLSHPNMTIEKTIENIKALLDSQIKAEPTRQLVYRRTLMHGQVIALRHYLERKMQRFLPPFEQEPKKAGRKRKVSYKLPGEIWK